MKAKLGKQQKDSFKLPSIGNKTMGDMFKQSTKQKQRPLSSKNIVSDLEKKLFSQLEAYDEKSFTTKFEKSSSRLKTKITSIPAANSCKDIQPGDSMQKIAQLMPQLYTKIIQSKNSDEVKPLKQTFVLNHEQNPGRLNSIQLFEKNRTNNDIKKKREKGFSQQYSKNRIQQEEKLGLLSRQKQSQKEPEMNVLQKQFENIYQKYLEDEGLSKVETSLSELRELNEDLNRCEVNIEELEKNYSSLIRQLGDICINQPQ